MYMKTKLVLLGVLMLAMGVRSYAQGYSSTDPNVITTAVPFVSIAPDARGGAMGDCGVASEADVFSMNYNPAKYSFLKEDFSVGLGYSPWLRNLVPDMNLAYLILARKLNSESAIAASLRYFSAGEVTFTDITGHETGKYSPNEWAFDATYSRMLTDYLSGAVAGRFIYSNLTQGIGEGSTAGWSIAADIGVYYNRPVEWFRDMDANFAWGISITNLGSKVSYKNTSIDRDFIPTTLRFGPSLKLDLDEYNSLTFMVDVSKLLVPTKPVRGALVLADGTMVNDTTIGYSNDVSVMAGVIQSFYDAPGYSLNEDRVLVPIGRGYEELCEYNFGVGVEYWYNNVFAVRGGYFNESARKGNRKYFSLGAALKYNVFGLDVSYLVPVSGIVGTNPLENTLRFNLTYNLGGAQ